MAQTTQQIQQSIVVVSKAPARYWRAGVALLPGENRLDGATLTAAQLAMLEADPRLSVTADAAPGPAAAPGAAQGSLVADSFSDHVVSDHLVSDHIVSGELTPPQSLVEAIKLLSPDNPEHFTNSGKPQTDALAKLMGQPVSAAARDDAWTAVQAGTQENTQADKA